MNQPKGQSLTSAAGPDDRPPIQSVVLPGQTPEGQHILGVLVKRTYDIVPGKRCSRAQVDKKLTPGNIYYGDPMNSTVKFESDFIPFKIATDVVLIGMAYAPKGAPTSSLTASLQVGAFRKDVRVIGDRFCRHRSLSDPIFTDPVPFSTMELRYERAYGGVDIYTDPKLPCNYPRNHLGRGYVIGTSKKAVDNLALPNLEDPKDLLKPARLSVGDFLKWESRPMPQGFGWFYMSWQPRASYAGVMPADRPYEQEMRKMYTTLIPPEQREMYDKTQLPDMDFRFFNGASPGLAVPFLSGDEDVRLSNLEPQGEIMFQLPGEGPAIGLDVGEGLQEPPVVLHTVMIRMEDRQLDLVWRAAAAYPGLDWLPQMRKMEVRVR